MRRLVGISISNSLLGNSFVSTPIKSSVQYKHQSVCECQRNLGWTIMTSACYTWLKQFPVDMCIKAFNKFEFRSLVDELVSLRLCDSFVHNGDTNVISWIDCSFTSIWDTQIHLSKGSRILCQMTMFWYPYKIKSTMWAVVSMFLGTFISEHMRSFLVYWWVIPQHP
jgi:hypothetical protein